MRARVQAVERRAATLERQAQDRLAQQERESSLWRSAMSLEMSQMREAMELKEERVRSLEAWVGRTEEQLDKSEEDHSRLASTTSDDSFLQMKLIQLVERIRLVSNASRRGIPYGDIPSPFETLVSNHSSPMSERGLCMLRATLHPVSSDHP